MLPSKRLRIGAVVTSAVLTVSTFVIATPAHADTISLSATYGTNAGTLNKNMLLNGSLGGYATAKNLYWLADQAPALAQLGMRQLRIDHVFDDSYYSVVTGVSTYDFAKLDRMILPLVRNGIKPWISLSYMPAALGPSIFGPPTSNTQWGNAVSALVNHYQALGYTGWNWEVWNEPDLAMFWSGTQAQYHQLYVTTANAVKGADATAQVGGPATTAAATTFLGQFLDYLAANPAVQCDFISWHDYFSIDFASVATVQGMLGARGIPAKNLYVTEWNSTSAMTGGAGTGPDTNVNAAYSAQRLHSATNQAGLTGAFQFSPVEGFQPTSTFNGDLGLITVDGHRKAAGNVFEMVNTMSDTLLTTVVAGAPDTTTYGMAAADTATKTVGVLVWNNSASSSTVNLSLSSLPYTTTFSSTQYLVDGTHGNYYTDYNGGLTTIRPGPNEDMQPFAKNVHAASASWSRSVTLGARSVSLFVLAPGSGPSVHVHAGVTNLAQGRPVSHSSTYTSAGQGWGPATVVDGRRYSFGSADSGSPTLGWTSVNHATASATEWVQVDLGSNQTLDDVTLWPRSDQAGDGVSFPSSFTIAGSTNGSSWATLVTKTGYSSGVPVHGPQVFDFPAGSYRYVRVTATQLGRPVIEGGGPTYRFQLAELEVARVRVGNASFETGDLGPWINTAGATVTSTGMRSGRYAATFTGTGTGVNVTVSGLSPNTTYTFGGSLKSSVAGDVVYLGAKDFGGTETAVQVGTTWYTTVSVTFATGPSSTSANIYAYKNSGGAQAWVDDLVLVQG